MSLDSTIFVFDSTFLILLITGVIFYFGLLSDTKNETSQYIIGIIFILTHFLVPFIVFYELHFGYIEHGNALWLNSYFLPFFLIQIVLMLFLIYCFCFLNVEYESKIKKLISRHPLSATFGQTLNVLLSWIMVGFGFYYSVNVCSVYADALEFPKSLVVLILLYFITWLPLLISLSNVSLSVIVTQNLSKEQ